MLCSRSKRRKCRLGSFPRRAAGPGEHIHIPKPGLGAALHGSIGAGAAQAGGCLSRGTEPQPALGRCRRPRPSGSAALREGANRHSKQQQQQKVPDNNHNNKTPTYSASGQTLPQGKHSINPSLQTNTQTNSPKVLRSPQSVSLPAETASSLPRRAAPRPRAPPAPQLRSPRRGARRGRCRGGPRTRRFFPAPLPDHFQNSLPQEPGAAGTFLSPPAAPSPRRSCGTHRAEPPEQPRRAPPPPASPPHAARYLVAVIIIQRPEASGVSAGQGAHGGGGGGVKPNVHAGAAGGGRRGLQRAWTRLRRRRCLWRGGRGEGRRAGGRQGGRAAAPGPPRSAPPRAGAAIVRGGAGRLPPAAGPLPPHRQDWRVLGQLGAVRLEPPLRGCLVREDSGTPTLSPIPSPAGEGKAATAAERPAQRVRHRFLPPALTETPCSVSPSPRHRTVPRSLLFPVHSAHLLKKMPCSSRSTPSTTPHTKTSLLKGLCLPMCSPTRGEKSV